MKLLAIVLGFVVAAAGAVGVIAPSVLLNLADSLLIPEVVYIAAAVRVLYGALLAWLAPISRAPRTLRVIGVLLVLAGVLTAFIGLEHSRAMLDWLVAQNSWVTRVWAGVPLLLGLFIAHALTGPHRFAS